MPGARVGPGASFDLDRPWRLAEGVALRRERFGALAYSFTTRRLSFLKSPRLLEVVASLDDASNAREACVAAGVQEAEIGAFSTALAALAAKEMIAPREEAE
jgi:putative mycofactocin binding protein MftB